MRIPVVVVAVLALSCVPDPLNPDEYVGGTLPTPDVTEDTAAPDVVDEDDVASHDAGSDVLPDVLDDVDDLADASDEGPDLPDPPPDEGPELPDAPDAADDGADVCVKDCAGKQCGPDGCGGVCGVCKVGEECGPSFQCKEPCDPQCDGKFCGPDGCGGACGVCMNGFECGVDGKCYDVTCVPECAGKVCGDDGCGAECGTCAQGDVCVDGACQDGPCTDIPAAGKCEGSTLFSCVDDTAQVANCAAQPGKICGWDPDKGAYGCIDKPVCTPQCVGKQCGADGCGGVCGVCPGGWACQTGACKAKAGGECGFYNAVGTCEDNVLYYCDAKKLFVQDCTNLGQTCGFDPEANVNQCLD